MPKIYDHFLVLGTDARQKELASLLRARHIPCEEADPDDPDTPAKVSRKENNIILFPISETPHCIEKLGSRLFASQVVFCGNVPRGERQRLEERGVRLYPYTECEIFSHRNASATAEGAIAEALLAGKETLQDSDVLVVGYGRCGMQLAHKLHALGAHVTVLERSLSKRCQIRAFGMEALSFDAEKENFSRFSCVFNTVPVQVVTGAMLEAMKKDVVLLELASKPGGINQNYCRNHDLPIRICPGLPARYAPKTAAAIMADTIVQVLKKDLCRTDGSPAPPGMNLGGTELSPGMSYLKQGEVEISSGMPHPDSNEAENFKNVKNKDLCVAEKTTELTAEIRGGAVSTVCERPSRTKVGFAITGSFCTFAKIRKVLAKLSTADVELYPIFSGNAQSIDSRFGDAGSFVREVEKIAGRKGIYTIPEAEPIGPRGYLDVLVIAPCTGNTLAKLAAGITDTPVLMAAKAHLRNEKPLVISLSTNDALAANLKNIGLLMNTKHIYFVPFGQDDYQKKPASMIAHVELIPDTIHEAMKGRQLEPVIR